MIKFDPDGKMLATHSQKIGQSFVAKARDSGLRLHLDKRNNQWYVASDEWVKEYHAEGGKWKFED
jgi:hypothetical protein